MTPTPSIRQLRKRADPTVVILPTAPDRQVKQNWTRAAAAERQALREATPWPGEYIAPWERERRAKEAALPSVKHIERTPALIIAICLFAMAPKEQRAGAYAVAKVLSTMRQGDACRDAVLMMDSVSGLTKDVVTVAAGVKGSDQ